MLRATGRVVRLTTRGGVSTKSGSPREWSITTARILVGESDVLDVQEGEGDHFRKGDRVDLAVEFGGVFAGQPQFRSVGDFRTVTGHRDDVDVSTGVLTDA